MMPVALHDLCAAIGGRLSSATRASANRICTDTRALAPGCLFVALRGERFDAHDYIAQAATAGAIGAVVDRDVTAPADFPLIHVDDTRLALGRIGHYLRSAFTGNVIAIGGSNGKTSTKHLVHGVLKAELTGSASPKSFNNDIGVPLTIADADPADDYLILELGTNHPGELRPLSLMARPHMAIITSASIEHLEGLGDLAGVIAEEMEIIAGLDNDGVLIVNGDLPELLAAADRFTGRRITFGTQPHNDLQAVDIRTTADGIHFQINGRTGDYFVPMLGRHTASNALAAIAVAEQLKLPAGAIARGLSTATGPEMRLQLQRIGPITLLNDAYNANPASMAAALQTLCDLPTEGRRIAVLGEMRELGPSSADLHYELGQCVAQHPVDQLIAVGQASTEIVRGAVAAGFRADCASHHATATDAAPRVAELVRPGDLVLLKGSRGIRLESIANHLQQTQSAIT